jgi:hypothetical protein
MRDHGHRIDSFFLDESHDLLRRVTPSDLDRHGIPGHSQTSSFLLQFIAERGGETVPFLAGIDRMVRVDEVCWTKSPSERVWAR